jgi:excisionase family DNA binding protein
MPHRRFNLKEVAAYLHLPAADVEQLVHHGEIPFERQGERATFVKREIDAWASQRILGLTKQRLETYHRRTSVAAHDLSKQHAIVAELLRRESLEPALASRTKPGALRDMVKLAERTGLVYTPDELLTSLQEREKLCSTGLPGGVALPHPRHQDPYMFGDSFVALGRAVHPIPFGAPDGGPADLFFLICCQDDRIHLHVLARLCMMCAQTEMVPALRAAADADGMFEALAQAEQEIIRRL